MINEKRITKARKTKTRKSKTLNPDAVGLAGFHFEFSSFALS
jgi:hypothetical protein